MIFVSVYSRLYRVTHTTMLSVEFPRYKRCGRPLFTLVGKNGFVHRDHAIHTPIRWRFYTGSVAKFLTLILGHNYFSPDVTWYQSDSQIAKLVPAELIRDKE